MGVIGKCPKCPAGTKEVRLINGMCHYHFDNSESVDDLLKTANKIVERVVKESKPLKKVSDKRKEQKKVYGGWRKKFIEENPVCQMRLPGCTLIATDLHHKEGCENEKLNDQSKCMTACRNCHRKETDDSKGAKERGNSLQRNTPIKRNNFNK